MRQFLNFAAEKPQKKPAPQPTSVGVEALSMGAPSHEAKSNTTAAVMPAMKPQRIGSAVFACLMQHNLGRGT